MGGSLGNVPYRVNASYTDNQGIIIKTSSMQRTTAGFNLSPKFFNETLSINANASGSYVRTRNSADVMWMAVAAAPVSPVQTVPHLRRRDQGPLCRTMFSGLLQQPQDHRRTRNIHRHWQNPLQLLNEQENIGKTLSSNGNLQIDYAPLLGAGTPTSTSISVTRCRRTGRTTPSPRTPSWHGAATTRMAQARSTTGTRSSATPFSTSTSTTRRISRGHQVEP